MIVGKTSIVGAAPVAVPTNQKRVSRFTLPKSAYHIKTSIYLDTLGSPIGSGNVMIKPIVYDLGGNLVSVGDELVLPSGLPPSWVDLSMLVTTPGGIPIAGPTDYFFGIHVGGIASAVRVYEGAAESGGGLYGTDTYGDGATALFGAATVDTARMSLYMTFSESWQFPENVTDFHLGRLPWVESQEAFAMGGPLTQARYAANVGWHGTLLDEEKGAFAVVNRDGPLSGLLGERLRISRADVPRRNFVYVYCHNIYPVLDDISLTRRAFLSLGQPAIDHLRCTVEVMA